VTAWSAPPSRSSGCPKFPHRPGPRPQAPRAALEARAQGERGLPDRPAPRWAVPRPSPFRNARMSAFCLRLRPRGLYSGTAWSTHGPLVRVPRSRWPTDRERPRAAGARCLGRGLSFLAVPPVVSPAPRFPRPQWSAVSDFPHRAYGPRKARAKRGGSTPGRTLGPDKPSVSTKFPPAPSTFQARPRARARSGFAIV